MSSLKKISDREVRIPLSSNGSEIRTGYISLTDGSGSPMFRLSVENYVSLEDIEDIAEALTDVVQQLRDGTLWDFNNEIVVDGITYIKKEAA